MRVLIEDYNKHLMPLYGVFGSRGEDPEKNKALAETVKAFDALIAKAEGKFLFGTDQPTMLDVMYAPFLEMIHDWQAPCVMANVLADCDFATNGAHIPAYIEKFRALPQLKNNWMNTVAGHKHWERTRGWEKGVKCQLTTSYLEESFKQMGWM